MKLHILLVLLIAALIIIACTSAPETEIIAASPEPETGQELLPTEAVETEPPAPTEVKVQETASMEEEPAEEQTTAQENLSGEKNFSIVPEETEARFLIDEVLLGSPFTVVGATNAVEGQIMADPNDPSNAQVTVRADLTTILTDNSRRNGAIQRWILETDQPGNQAAEFNSTSVSGVPVPVDVGQPFDFQINGDLTVKGTTKPLTFKGTATLGSPDRLEGSASTNLLYTEFTTIPSLPPQVASVEEEMVLQIDFVALAD